MVCRARKTIHTLWAARFCYLASGSQCYGCKLAAKTVSLHTGCVTLATCSPSVDLWISCNTELLFSQRISSVMEGNDRTGNTYLREHRYRSEENSPPFLSPAFTPWNAQADSTPFHPPQQTSCSLEDWMTPMLKTLLVQWFS